jgi:hypothetical protein
MKDNNEKQLLPRPLYIFHRSLLPSSRRTLAASSHPLHPESWSLLSRNGHRPELRNGDLRFLMLLLLLLLRTGRGDGGVFHPVATLKVVLDEREVVDARKGRERHACRSGNAGSVCEEWEESIVSKGVERWIEVG